MTTSHVRFIALDCLHIATYLDFLIQITTEMFCILQFCVRKMLHQGWGSWPKSHDFSPIFHIRIFKLHINVSVDSSTRVFQNKFKYNIDRNI